MNTMEIQKYQLILKQQMDMSMMKMEQRQESGYQLKDMHIKELVMER